MFDFNTDTMQKVGCNIHAAEWRYAQREKQNGNNEKAVSNFSMECIITSTSHTLDYAMDWTLDTYHIHNLHQQVGPKKTLNLN